MDDFLVALGLVLVIEGILYAAFPAGMRRTVAAVLESPDGVLRISGLVASVLGLVMIWLVRG